jgi:hypothetical protein
MLYNDIKHLKESQFKRLTGVKPALFEKMLSSVDAYFVANRKHASRGRPAKLSHADKLLLLLMYYREYRTMYHISIAYGIGESTVCEIIKEYESILLKDKQFHLPGKKQLLSTENDIEVVLIDVTESPVERPKKNSEKIIQARKKDTPKKHK